MNKSLVAGAGVVATLPLALYLWGFMVDDALITARYAAHIADGTGYRFNVGGAVTDGVTPLGFAYVLAPFAWGGPVAAFDAARVLGFLSWMVASGLIAVAIHSIRGARTKWLGLLLMATSAPLAAWCSAGMETGMVIGLAGSAVALHVLRREGPQVACLAIVAAWRPEAIPWALAVALSPSRDPDRRLSRWIKLGVVGGTPVLVAGFRYLVFGHAMPLSAIAKPSTVALGGRYALACALLCGVVAIVGVRRVPNWTLGLGAAVVVHWLSMMIVGGDWMPVSRLATTALPTLAVVAAALAARPPGPQRWLDRGWLTLRFALALGGQLFVLYSHGPRLRAVTGDRFEVIKTLSPRLSRATSVAALDIGWVGVSTRATVVDLAGVTDPEIALLGGGHTSKRIPPWLLDARHVDMLVVRLRSGEGLQDPWYMSRFATFVDMWVATTPNVAEGFSVVEVYGGEPRYVVLERRQ